MANTNEEQMIVGLDIGTSKVAAIVGVVSPEGTLEIIGAGLQPSSGLKKGVVVNIEVTVNSIQRAIEEAELMGDCNIHSVFVGIAGSHIRSLNSHGIVAIRDQEVLPLDIERVIDAARAVAIPADQEILHVLPQEYIIDNQEGVHEPLGMSGVRLESKVHLVTCAANAAQKAFVVNRVGDFGLLLGILGLFWATKSFDFNEIAIGVSQSVSENSLPVWAALLLCFLVFLGPMAKSAQFPLHVWLPDAMEGPTPISALIHAATMVAAGIFLVARLQPLYSLFPSIQFIIALVGTITCFLGASIALTQMDLKKGLAYSTVSQLGYMMLAMGCGAPVAGIFHLITHACFKAMLFLGSGSVIHAMEEVVGHQPVLAQDMRLMGGLRKKMPFTSTTFLIGCVAISGIPPLAGFWSKDEILGNAFISFPAFWFVGFLTAGMTAFYMFRLYFLTFEGDFRGEDKELQKELLLASKINIEEEHEEEHGSLHESPWSMTFPLVFLAVPSVIIGFMGFPWDSKFANLLDPEEALIAIESFELKEFLPLAIASVFIASIGITIAYQAYFAKKINLSILFAQRFPSVNKFLSNKWYLDDINEKLFVKGSRKLAKEVLEVDSKVVDGVVNLTGLVTLGSGEGLKYFETGRAQFYALIVFGGVILLVAIFGFQSPQVA